MADFGMPVSKEADIFTPTATAAGADHARPAVTTPQVAAPGTPQVKRGSDTPAQYLLHAASPDIVVEQPSAPAPLIRNRISSAETARTQTPNTDASEPDPAVLARRLLDTFTPVKKANTGIRSEGAQLDEFVDLLHTSKDFRFHRPDGSVDVRKIPKSVLEDLRKFQLGRFGKSLSGPTRASPMKRMVRVSRSYLEDPEPVFTALKDMVVQASLARRFTDAAASRRQELVNAALKRVGSLQESGTFQEEISKLKLAITQQGIEPQKALEAFIQGKQ